MRDAPIGIFDSGVGGLTVVSELSRILPNESIIYFGDIARTPYGSKSKELVKKYAYQLTEFLIQKRVKLIIIACNTASSVSFHDLNQSFKDKVKAILDVIHPAVKAAINQNNKYNKHNKIGIIGTKTTIEVGSFEDLIKKRIPSIKIIKQACPLFVPLVEEGWINHKITYQVAEEYLKIFKEEKIDSLILACTHYPLLKNVIKKILKVKLIDTSIEVSKETKRVLTKLDLLNTDKSNKSYKFYVSDEPGKFIEISKRFLNFPIDRNCVEKVELW
jgi:glutamate racemase